MCTNVSMWGAVYWTAENVTECKCEIEKMEETKMEQVRPCNRRTGMYLPQSCEY